MENSISVPFDFIDKYVRFTKPEYLQVYLYVRYLVKKTGEFPSSDEVSAALNISPAKAEFIFEYWVSRDIFSFSDGVYEICGDDAANPKASDKKESRQHRRIQSSRPAYSQSEINAAAASNKQISGLFYQAETILNKILTASEMEMLFSFNDWLGLPVEVIMMLLSYAVKKGKTTKRYLETVAIDWADKGIDTYEAAEAYVSELEAIDSAERSIRSILGIYNRNLSPTEKKYIKLWTEDLKIPTELVSLAYDKTVTYTGKLSWSYMDKLLQSWISAGYETAEQVKAADEEFYRNGGKSAEKDKKKSRFNNYEDENKPDYSELEKQLFDMMLEDSGIESSSD